MKIAFVVFNKGTDTYGVRLLTSILRKEGHDVSLNFPFELGEYADELFQAVDEDKVSKLIDVIALTGILWNVSIVGSKHGEIAGLAKGFMLIIVAFMIPNLFMEYFVETLCGDEEEESKCSHHVKLFTGIVFVIILLGCEYFLSHLLDKVKWKKKRH